MNNLLKINFSRRQKLTSLLGLALDGSRLDGVVLRRTNGSLQVQQTFSVTLSLDPLTAAPELVGREIRNHLDAAGVRERRCVVGVPMKWMLTAHTELPPLPEADAASLLQLEAERGFPCDVATLRLANSRCRLPADKQFVTLAGIPNNQLATLEQVLAAAKLRPLGFSPGVTVLQPPAATDGVLALAIGENQVSLQITAGGGVAALRSLEGAVENEGARRALNADFVAREARITLGQLPAGLRDSVRRIRIFGPRDLAQPLADVLELRFEPMGLQVDLVAAYAPDEFGAELPPAAPVSAAFSLAARRLTGQAPVFEFLPPKPGAWRQMAAKYSSSRLRTAGAVAAGIIVLVGGLFLFQEIQLVVLRSQWSAMVGPGQDPGRRAATNPEIPAMVRQFVSRPEHPAAAHAGISRGWRRHGQVGGNPRRQPGQLLRHGQRQCRPAADVEPVAHSGRCQRIEGGPDPRQIADAIHV